MTAVETAVITYRTHPDHDAENHSRVQAVFAELHRRQPSALEYSVYRAADEHTYVHIVTNPVGTNPLGELTQFDDFRDGLPVRCEAAPIRTTAELVGAYRPTATTNEHTVLQLLKAFVDADLNCISTLVADDIAFDSRRSHLVGRDNYLRAVGNFVELLTGVDILSTTSNADHVTVIYDMHTLHFGTLRVVDNFTVQDGLVVKEQLMLDLSPFTLTGLR